MTSQSTNQGPPYVATTWSLGGRPTISVDVPITTVFLALYIVSASWHMSIYQKNKRRGHKFIFSVLLFGFSMARIVTCIMRIASVCLPGNTNLSIAASVFVGAAILLVFIINLLWSQRILRSLHPIIGWHRATKILFLFLYVLTGLTLAINITGTVQNFFTLRPRTKFIDRALLLYGQTCFVILSSLPILVIGLALTLHHRGPIDKFGAGKPSIKVAVLIIGTLLVSTGAWYRCATTWQPPVPRTQPLPRYFAKPCFYVFNFGVEILTSFLYAGTRVDLRFHVPDGAKGPGSYARLGAQENSNYKSISSSAGKLRSQSEA